jgi:NAD/NADP transhydrogenase alpha subunit
MRNIIMKNKHIVALVSALILASGCATATSDTTNASGGDFAAAWEAAEAKRKEAGKMGAEWRDTGKMLKQAKKASEDGDAEKAMKLVAKAHEQSEDAIAQYERESSLWSARVPQ